MIEMRKDRLDAWTTALRSGQYPQTTEALRDDRGFCCLGVACEISPIEGKANARGDFLYDGYDANLPYSVIEWLGIRGEDSENPVMFHGFQNKLTGMNDNDQLNFTEIADWLETNVGTY